MRWQRGEVGSDLGWERGVQVGGQLEGGEVGRGRVLAKKGFVKCDLHIKGQNTCMPRGQGRSTLYKRRAEHILQRTECSF